MDGHVYRSVEAESTEIAFNRRPHCQIQCSLLSSIQHHLLEILFWALMILHSSDLTNRSFSVFLDEPPPHQNSKCCRAPEVGPVLHSLSYLHVPPG